MLDRASKEDIQQIAERIGWFRLTADEAAEYATLSSSILAVLDEVETPPLPQPTAEQPATAARTAGRAPTPAEDPYNAIVRWCRVQRTDVEGPLTGLRVAAKDSISVAGVPLTLGSKVLRDFTPTTDSVVAERLLAAGAEIVAITNMDNFAFSGGADTSGHGNILNPFNSRHSAGGSSGGSGAALYYQGVVDAALGCDQGGSIRLPAAWCGVVGLKPTHSLVPYTGIAGIDATFDHVGPMARSAATLGRVLAAIAGPHPTDPRQAGVTYQPELLQQAMAETTASFDGVRIGLLAEGFAEDDDARKRNSAAVRGAAEKLAAAGAVVDEVSIPAHLHAGGIAFAGFIEGMAALTSAGGNGYHRPGRYSPDLAVAMAKALRRYGDELAPQIKVVMLLGEHLRRSFGGAVYASAQNQRPWLRAQYDEALRDHDFLLLPTAPYAAYRHDDGLGLAERVLRGWEPLGNCAPFDMSGHPAITLPVATVDKLPVGAMLVGRRFEDHRLVDVACRYERGIGWDPVIVQRHGTPTGPAAPPA